MQHFARRSGIPSERKSDIAGIVLRVGDIISGKADLVRSAMPQARHVRRDLLGHNNTHQTPNWIFCGFGWPTGRLGSDHFGQYGIAGRQPMFYTT